MQIIDARAEDFADVFDRVVNARRESEQNVSRDVAEIIAKVRAHGDKALAELTMKLDGHHFASEDDWKVPAWRCERAYDKLDGELRDALNLAADRIRAYHRRRSRARATIPTMRACGSAIAGVRSMLPGSTSPAGARPIPHRC